MTIPTSSLVAEFAAKLETLNEPIQGVDSPLGLWLLLALLAPASTGAAREELTAVLGADPDDAVARAQALLDNPHPDVKTAIAAWVRLSEASPATLSAVNKNLPENSLSDIPSQVEANEWARRNTMDLISEFPATLDANTLVVLASALASKIAWQTAFDDTTLEDLGGEFSKTASTALASAEDHNTFLAKTSAGVVGVHAASSASNMIVVSVIADPSEPPKQVHEAVQEVIGYLTNARFGAKRVNLFDLPLGQNSIWSLTERQYESAHLRGNTETYRSVLAPWSAESNHDLLAAPGVASALTVLSSLFPNTAAAFSAQQAAVASYNKEGFEAAAITFMSMARSAMPMGGTVTERECVVRFNRAYAVSAFTRYRAISYANHRYEQIADEGWEGLSVFRAWVAKPS